MEAVKTGAEWGSDLARRFIWYDISVRVAYALFALAVLLLGRKYVPRIWAWCSGMLDEDSNPGGFFLMFLVIIPTLVVCVISILLHLQYVLRDIIIPEIRIIEVLNGLT